jgi:hypothetical protein
MQSGWMLHRLFSVIVSFSLPDRCSHIEVIGTNKYGFLLQSIALTGRTG